jgi:hypothetical protein
MKTYKVLSADGSPCNGGSGTWHLPKGKRPGKWMEPIKGELIPCENGYHLCRRKDIMQWLNESIYEAEYRGEIIKQDDKIVVREVRLLRKLNWNDKIARLFAADCAYHVLEIFERVHPDDLRPRQATEAARAFARGEINQQDMTVAWTAARDAAWDAAWTAARAAAWAATRAATRAAARAAAGAAAWDAEQKWQSRRLFEYLEGRR